MVVDDGEKIVRIPVRGADSPVRAASRASRSSTLRRTYGIAREMWLSTVFPRPVIAPVQVRSR